MSTILDALRRVQRDRRDPLDRDLQTSITDVTPEAPPPPRRRGRGHPGLWIGVCLVVLLATGTAFARFAPGLFVSLPGGGWLLDTADSLFESAGDEDNVTRVARADVPDAATAAAQRRAPRTDPEALAVKRSDPRPAKPLRGPRAPGTTEARRYSSEDVAKARRAALARQNAAHARANGGASIPGALAADPLPDPASMPPPGGPQRAQTTRAAESPTRQTLPPTRPDAEQPLAAGAKPEATDAPAPERVVPKTQTTEEIVVAKTAAAEVSPEPAPKPAAKPAKPAAEPAAKPAAKPAAERSAKPATAPAARPTPPPEPSEPKPAPAAKRAAVPQPVAPPASRKDDSPLAGPSFPDVRVDSIRWHPSPERRRTHLEFPTIVVDEAREGDIIAGVMVKKILPDAVELQVGDTTRRLGLE